MTVTTFDRAHLIPTPWKNGGGRTQEIARAPSNSTMNTFDWRVSIAEISADGPFSTFVGVDRVLVLLSGGGVILRSSDGTIDRRLNEPFVPFAFRGETPVDATLVTGPSSDFNVMTRRGSTRADTQVVIAHKDLHVCAAGVLFAARGAWDIRAIEDESLSLSLESNQGVWWDGEPLAWQLDPRSTGSALIAVQLFQ